MQRKQIIELFKLKPRHAGRLLLNCMEIANSPGISIPEKAYNYCFPEIAEIHLGGCFGCGKPFKNFISFTQGYRKYCSPSCSNGSLQVKQNKKQGMLKKYGVENPMQSVMLKAKAQATNLKRYGSITPLRQAEVQEKVRDTLQKRYGVDHPFKLESTKKAARLGVLKTYASESWNDRLTIIEATCNVKLEELSRDYKGPYGVYSWKHSCETIYQSSALSGSILSCPKCKVKFRSSGEEELAAFIEKYQPIIRNDRNIVRPYELDIYCPSNNLAVEYNGLYWHSDEWKKPDYHLKKLLACQKKGIRLIQIFEDEWLNKKEIVKSRLLSILGFSNRIYARNCSLRDVPSHDAVTFLNDNHLQGSCGSSIRLGLYQNDKLMALMTFGKPRFNHNYDLELLRFCSLSGTTIVGSASKLFAEFKKRYIGSTVISYADRRWSEGNLYHKLGMINESISPPSYFYVISGTRLNRVSAQKHKLNKILGNKFNPLLSERENMKNAGFHRIYDCGNHIYTYKL